MDAGWTRTPQRRTLVDVDGADELDEGEDELLAVGARRPSRWRGSTPDAPVSRGWLLVRRGALTLAALAVVVVGIRSVSQPAHRPKAAPAPTIAAVTPAPRAPVHLGPLDDVRALAENPGALISYVRVDTPAGACPLVRPGHSPVRAVVRAERARLGAVRLLDSATTLDQATGLCQLAVRTWLHHAVITVSITPKTRGRRAPFDRLETGVDTVDGVTVEYARMISRDRWQVVVGATGRRARSLPGSQDLLNVAQARRMLW